MKSTSRAIYSYVKNCRCRKGNRPSFDRAEAPEKAKAMYEHAIAMIRGEGIAVSSGEFAADMQVSLVNDGPVTFLLESRS